MLTLREVHRVVAGRSGAEPGDGKMGHETLGDRTDLGCLCEQPGKRQRTSQDELGESPIRIYLDRLAQALDPVDHPPEIDVGDADEEVPVEEERIARTQRIASATWARVSRARPSENFICPR
jgi:hypothetical protein